MVKSDNFKAIYAKYYNLTYAQKDYAGEAVFFDSLLKKFSSAPVSKIISLGTGTLGHEKFLAKSGYKILGIDLSAKMVSIAKERIKTERLKNISVKVGDMRSFKTSEKYQAVLSMFNVISYCRNLSELDKVFKTANNCLVQDGLFIFDCWNAVAIEKDPPKDRFAKFKKGATELYRLTSVNPTNDPAVIDLEIKLFAFENKRFAHRSLERHLVRAWYKTDVVKLLKKNKFSFIKASEFGNINKPISDKKWAMTIIAKKK